METRKMRKSVRFKPDPLDVAFVGDVDDDGKFHPIISAYIMDESGGGCSVIVDGEDKYQVGSTILIKVGRMSPIESKVIYARSIIKDRLHIGLQYQSEVVD
jgi:hypothetical protein